MISIVKKGERLDPVALVGKYIMRDAGFHWAAFHHPRLVLSHSGSKLAVANLDLDFNEHDHRWSRGTRGAERYREYDPEPQMVASVRVVCDTVEDVLLIMNAGQEAAEAYTALKMNAHRALQALDGVSAVIDERDDAPAASEASAPRR